MRNGKRTILILMTAAVLGIAGAACAQMGPRGMMPQGPPMVGALQATVGAGSQYQMTTEQGAVSFTIVVVGKETVDGGEGTWLENRFEGGRQPGEMVQKQLMVMQDGKVDIKRMIVQAPGRPPMEIPMGMMGMMGQRGQRSPSAGQGSATGDTNPGVKIGSESVTVPAGTFTCEHYHKQTDRGAYDYWISTSVTPYPIVKMSGPSVSMVLQKVLSGETSHIHGDPQQMPGMPH